MRAAVKPLNCWRGRCASCARPIAVRYPLVELATAGLFAAIAWTVPLAMPLPGLPTAVVLLAFWWFAGVSVVLFVVSGVLRKRSLADVTPAGGTVLRVSLRPRPPAR